MDCRLIVERTNGRFHPNTMGEINPAVRAFVSLVKDQALWGQVLIERSGHEFRLRHGDDRQIPVEKLEAVPCAGLRKLAMFNAAGQFRPLRAAPDLRRGWICACNSEAELAQAILELYPGSIFDWFAVELNAATPTGYREFTKRQSGMYRITQSLSDEHAVQVAKACCAPSFCLKRRLWTVPGLEPDAASQKAAIPCLEPCAALLELARKAARIEQESKVTVQMSPSEFQSLILATRLVVEGHGSTERIGNIGSPVNPRRLQLVLEKYGNAVDVTGNPEEE
jgi:hypothetical protein